MKFAWIAVVSVLCLACQGNTQDKAHVMKTQKDSVSYTIGMNIGRDIKRQALEIDPDILAQGIKDMMGDGKTLLTDEQAQACMMAFQQEMHVKQEEKKKVDAEKNKKEGEAFLAANKVKEGVKITASGLQYKVITEGHGPKPTATQTVIVNYRGTLIDGTEFDGSAKRGKPGELALSQVVKGWQEALQMMPVGSKWQIFIPSDLGWGDQGAPPLIGPGAVVIFEVELLDIKK